MRWLSSLANGPALAARRHIEAVSHRLDALVEQAERDATQTATDEQAFRRHLEGTGNFVEDMVTGIQPPDPDRRSRHGRA